MLRYDTELQTVTVDFSAVLDGYLILLSMKRVMSEIIDVSVVKSKRHKKRKRGLEPGSNELEQ